MALLNVTIRNKRHSCTSFIINTPEAGTSSHAALRAKAETLRPQAAAEHRKCLQLASSSGAASPRQQRACSYHKVGRNLGLGTSKSKGTHPQRLRRRLLHAHPRSTGLPLAMPSRSQLPRRHACDTEHTAHLA